MYRVSVEEWKKQSANEAANSRVWNSIVALYQIPVWRRRRRRRLCIVVASSQVRWIICPSVDRPPIPGHCGQRNSIVTVLTSKPQQTCGQSLEDLIWGPKKSWKSSTWFGFGRIFHPFKDFGIFGQKIHSKIKSSYSELYRNICRLIVYCRIKFWNFPLKSGKKLLQQLSQHWDICNSAFPYRISFLGVLRFRGFDWGFDVDFQSSLNWLRT